MASSKLQAFWNHPAGPKTIHFWAPTFKWGISIANIADFAKPPEKISYPQQVGMSIPGTSALVFQTTNSLVYYTILVYLHATSVVWCTAVACTGIIWSRYSMVITPKNWNLFSVNVAMAGTGLYQLSRKIRKDYFEDEKEVAASLEG
ncbi:mitochondrial pyruvate carrier 4-like isoform X1 [Hordeum vulgare subsp. vulgare]|uniref:mitochondrial pyruvate carrier 4-like isoform X1 n=1 Tax=Hordeum vulgare subsp. vulgare TaxID=112509 RepID=UPI001D1A4AE5|nr:mitochondrial pyruvate carrier 4-like isoform X1 [Hordeum vulgare subsp. vulgare]XP_044965388.1 mitochondrial pyruvate carrier 4-like isoform X1 [Hordeum vulgare subsp. vulgare]